MSISEVERIEADMNTSASRPAPDMSPEERIRPRTLSYPGIGEFAGSALSGLCLAWLIFYRLAPFGGALGFFVTAYVFTLIIYSLVMRDRHGRIAATDRVAAAVVSTAGSVLIFALGLIVGYTIYRGYSALRPQFFTETQQFVGPLSDATEGGGAHAIVGSLEQVGLATLMCVPLGIATALFLTEVGGRMARPVRLIVDAMSGVPSILAGLFIYATLVLSLGIERSGFVAALALSILMVPTVTRTAEVVLRLVPGGLREASLALGGTDWRTVRQVILPTARSGLATAVILSIARIVGETAPLILTAGGAFVMNANPFAGFQDALPLFVFRLIRSPQPAQVERGWTGALVLITIVLILFVVARIIGGQGPGHIGRRRRKKLQKRGLL